MEFSEVARILQAVREAQAADELIDLAPVAADLGMSVETARELAIQVDGCGLALTGLVSDELPPILLDAERQYLDMRGEVDWDVLHFLPTTVDDLHAREALLHGGTLRI